jgi:NitT/TauT family transport system permease protein
MVSSERKLYLKKIKKDKIIINFFRVFIFIFFIFIWELLSRLNLIDTFMFSSPSNIIKTIIDLYKDNNLFIHIFTTLYEIIISFIIGSIIGFIISSILYLFDRLNKILDPYLTILNSLPKVALGPLIIILFGANTKSIIIMALLISVIVSIMNISSIFKSTDINKIKIVKSMGGNKLDILFRVVIPSNYLEIIDSFKVNISLIFIGVIMGEFLVSKQGIGYLINYGSQILNMNLVLSGISLLVLLTIILYCLILLIDKIIRKTR